ncbi:unnamed protein product [Chironomus riparius]|uniref:Uncharacterized protein n=1 Tax=Chironomus riparius TaxID=315576 RepID=A0A9N9S3V6_9DIPT|nr:unnamed protein product [Chironomus riparius]
MKVFLFLLVSFAEVYMQEYYLNSNGSSSFVPYQSTIELNIPVYQYDTIMRHYRSDIRKREPQFISFDINDENIEIDMEIAVPFLSVPTKKSLSKRRNFANVNVAAVILAAMVAIGGTVLGGAARFIRGENFFNGQPWFRTGNKKTKQKRDIHEINSNGHEAFVWNILNNIDEALLEIDVDVTECAQRFVCWHVKNSLLNMQENRANNIDKFIIGFVNAKWTNKVISNTIWNNAIEAARKEGSCMSTFRKCMPDNLEIFANKIQQYAKPKK